MTRPNMHTATLKGVTHTESQNGWQRLTGRSRTFLVNMIQEAAEKGISPEKRMQYAIEQKPGDRNSGGRGHEHGAGDGHRRTREEKVMMANISMINKFMYGGK